MTIPRHRIPEPDTEPSTDVIGHRVLVGIQVVNISRLSTHPIPVVGRGLVTVAGQGPKDSNGAGKSSLIAAMSLLHGDEQWRWGSGAAGAARLLFSAEGAAQDGTFGDAEYGYIIGVFADPGATTTADLDASAVTVWLRINPKAPFIDLRWEQGLFVPSGVSEKERVSRVNDLWGQMRRRGNRQDVHGNRLRDILYGGHVRCVSFLSTTVRSSHTPNLLAQDLNTLEPERIFDAIAALTSLDHELEQQRSYRALSHARKEEARKDVEDFARWNAEAAHHEERIIKREQARDLLAKATAAWKARCAVAVSQAYHLSEGYREDIRNLARSHQERAEKIDRLKAERAYLEDDAALTAEHDTAKARQDTAEAEFTRLSTKRAQLTRDLDDLQNQSQELQGRARFADGKDLDTAHAELFTAGKQVDEALTGMGVPQQERLDAQKALAQAESGVPVASAALEALHAAGVHAAPLLDIVSMRPDQRQVWEPRLHLYRDAIVVDQIDGAVDAVGALPGTTLIASGKVLQPGEDLPHSSDDRLQLSGFFTALASWTTTADSGVDASTGVVVVGGFAQPTTGRATRISSARARVEAAARKYEEAENRLAAARRNRTAAERRRDSAAAAADLPRVNKQIARKRDAAVHAQAALEAQNNEKQAAQQTYMTVFSKVKTRQEQRKNLQSRIDGLQGEQTDNAIQRAKREEDIKQLGLSDLMSTFGSTDPEDAEHYLADLEDEEQKTWGLSDWDQEITQLVQTMFHKCFPHGTAAEEIPTSILGEQDPDGWMVTINAARRSRKPQDDLKDVFRHLIGAFSAHLDRFIADDAFQQRRISTQRADKEKSIATGIRGADEAAASDAAHRAAVAEAVKSTLTLVAKQFDELDKAYGGYGADLEFVEPEAPLEPDQPWRWAVTPRWRRDHGKPLASYRQTANTAQLDEKAVKLVCAAAAAGATKRPLLLVLDELGRNLGKQHRSEVVALFERIGVDRDITVIGALQDDMERFAIDASNEFIKLRRHSDSQPYNDPPVIIGHDTTRDRITLLSEWMATGHTLAARTAAEEQPR